MSDDQLYEFITPSDPLTFYAYDDKIAIVAALLVGRGKAGLHNVTQGRDLSSRTLLLFLTKEQVMDEMHAALECPLEDFVNEHREAVARAMDSFATMNKDERRMFDEARKHMSAEEFEKFRLRVDDICRSSLSRWSEHAWSMAKNLREGEQQ